MPRLKIKMNSSVKKRFSLTAGGLVKASQANKQHNMRKRSKRQLREQRGTAVLPKCEQVRIKKSLRVSPL